MAGDQQPSPAAGSGGEHNLTSWSENILMTAKTPFHLTLVQTLYISH